MKFTLPVLLLLLVTPQLFAQKKVPVLRTNSTNISIKEGDFLYKDVWHISPEAKPDVFVTNHFSGTKKVTFYSELDSITFTVKPNRKYDFIVLQNGKDTAYTQINTSQKEKATLNPKPVLSRRKPSGKAVADTLHFTLGKNSWIYLKGKVNGSDSLDFIFDTGAGISVVTKSLIDTKKIKVTLDGNQENIGADGVSTVMASSSNTLEIDNLVWKGVPLLAVDYKNFLFDAVLGWVAFEDKIVELNYDKSVLVVHEVLPALDKEYSRLDMKLIDGIPYIKCKTIVNGVESEAWFDLDTGSDGTITVGQKYAADNLLNDGLKIIGKSTSTGSTGNKFTKKLVVMPKIKLGDFELYQVPIHINDADPVGVANHENIGNVILKRFNAIIDFRNNVIYLKPNRLFYSPM